MRTNEGRVDDELSTASAQAAAPGVPHDASQPADAADASKAGEAAPQHDGFDPGDWKSRIIAGRATGAAAQPPAWLDASYETLRTHVMDPAYPCFFGTMAEKRGEMFYSYVNGKDIGDLAATMETFAELVSLPQYRKNNIAVFFEPDTEPLTHDAYHALFWRILQHLHDVDPDPNADAQPEPSSEDWEFSFAGVETFVVCACPSFRARHSRNLGPGMVLLFQPRSVFVDTITNKVIGREARNQVRKRLETWDEISAHPDLGFFGDPGNLEWKQYFLDDANVPADDRCPFLKRQREARQEAVHQQAVRPAVQQDVAKPQSEHATAAYGAQDSHTWWQRHPVTPTDNPFTPHPVRHAVEHRFAQHGGREQREYEDEQ